MIGHLFGEQAANVLCSIAVRVSGFKILWQKNCDIKVIIILINQGWRPLAGPFLICPLIARPEPVSWLSSARRLVHGLGTHGLSCRFSKGQHPRNAVVNNVIKRSLDVAHLELKGLRQSDGKGPDGAFVVP